MFFTTNAFNKEKVQKLLAMERDRYWVGRGIEPELPLAMQDKQSHAAQGTQQKITFPGANTRLEESASDSCKTNLSGFIQNKTAPRIPFQNNFSPKRKNLNF